MIAPPINDWLNCLFRGQCWFVLTKLYDTEVSKKFAVENCCGMGEKRRNCRRTLKVLLIQPLNSLQ